MRLRNVSGYSLVLLAAILAPLASAQSQPARAPDVPYVPTSNNVVQAMLKLAGVTNMDVVYDLGCGDGRIVITAAQQFGARGVGIDINPARIQEANANAKQAGVTDKVRFEEKDLFEADIKEASVVTLYLLSSVNMRLRPKLLADLKPGTRVVSNTFDMGDWKPDREEEIDGRRIMLWTVPARGSGGK
jgi:SAM-dependent methyltransferase